jgi:hypothetical protein
VSSARALQAEAEAKQNRAEVKLAQSNARETEQKKALRRAEKEVRAALRACHDESVFVQPPSLSSSSSKAFN